MVPNPAPPHARIISAMEHLAVVLSICIKTAPQQAQDTQRAIQALDEGTYGYTWQMHMQSR